MLGHGTTITFSSGFLAEILSLQWTGIERMSVPTTHFGTTGGKTFVPADLTDPGELVVEMHHDATATPPLTGVAETVTITWPTGAPAETHACSGFLSGYEINAADEEKVRATSRLKLTGPITW